jgi:uncharacterized membrane protein
MQKLTKNVRLVLLVYAVAGLLLSLYLAYEYAQPLPMTCPLGGTSCEAVRQSAYSVILGVPTPIWGSLFFVTLIGFIIVGIINKIRIPYYSKLLLGLLSWGIFFETVMTGLQVFVIHSICTWCVMIEVVVFCMFMINAVENYLRYRKSKLAEEVLVEEPIGLEIPVAEEIPELEQETEDLT